MPHPVYVYSDKCLRILTANKNANVYNLEIWTLVISLLNFSMTFMQSALAVHSDVSLYIVITTSLQFR